MNINKTIIEMHAPMWNLYPKFYFWARVWLIIKSQIDFIFTIQGYLDTYGIA